MAAGARFTRDFSGLDIAQSISPSLAKRSVAMIRDGVLSDVSDSIDADATIEFIARDDPRALELIRHDAAHVLAEAVQSLWPGTQVTIGPVIDNGFYYDFFRETSLSRRKTFRRSKRRCARSSRATAPSPSRCGAATQAKSFFEKQGEAFKIELIDAIPADQPLKVYAQGDWLDLCRGPHMTSTGKIGEAFKLMKVAGAYWRGDSNRPMLSRIYATAFAGKPELDAYLKQIEEAERRDHRKLAREMDLFHFQEEGPGAVFWHPKGWTLFQTLIAYMRRRQDKAGFIEVNTPQVLDRALWETSGHWQTYREHMFVTTTEDERVFALKPMNCPGHVQIFKNGLKSYRDLPMKIAEFGIVHRYEPSGALHGVMRVRAFTQDDAHIFCTEDQIMDESMKVNDLILSIYEDFGFKDVVVKLSTRPEKRVGSDEVWDKSEAALREVLARIGNRLKTSINPGEGAFYGPKLEYVLADAIGRDWQCGTMQVDFNMPGLFGAFYIGADSEKKTPVMLHRAMFGSLERFTGILLEHYAGHLPLWLSPLQIVVCTITQEADDYALEVVAEARRRGLRVEADLRNEKITYKVREHSLAKVPALLVVGRKEAAERSASIRRLGSSEQRSAALADALDGLAQEALAPDQRG